MGFGDFFSSPCCRSSSSTSTCMRRPSSAVRLVFEDFSITGTSFGQGKTRGIGSPHALSLLRLLIAQALHHREMMLERRQCLGGEVLQWTGLSVLRVVAEELDRILVRGKLLGDI